MEILYYVCGGLILLLFVIAECLKNEGLLKQTQYIRTCILVIGGIVAVSDCQLVVRLITEFFTILTFVLYSKDTFTQQKIYPKNLDVPRQLLYREDKVTGKCYVLSDKEAKTAHEQGENVFIHATVRVKYETYKNNGVKQ